MWFSKNDKVEVDGKVGNVVDTFFYEIIFEDGSKGYYKAKDLKSVKEGKK